MTDTYVIKVTYEKNATDGISYYTSKQDLAEAVHNAELGGGCVQVYKCVPIEHEVYVQKPGIDLYE